MPTRCSTGTILVASAFLLAATPRVVPAEVGEKAEAAEAPPDKKVVPLRKRRRAPFTGFLVREEKFLHYLECDIKLTEQQGLADARMEALKELGKEVVDRRQRNWFERNSFALGMATGLAVSTVLLFGAAEVMNAAK